MGNKKPPCLTMENHPLIFFKSLIEDPKNIQELRKKFYDSDREHRISEDYETEVIEEWFLDADDEVQDGFRFFATSFEYLCAEEIKNFKKTVDLYILSELNDDAANNYLKRIHTELQYLIKEFPEKVYVSQYPVIQEILRELQNFLIEKHHLPQLKKSTPTLPNITKMQWLGNTNQLTTLLKDLCKGFPDKNIPPLLSATDAQLEELIINNFIDKSGQTFEKGSTIGKYLQDGTTKIPPGDKRIDVRKYSKDND